MAEELGDELVWCSVTSDFTKDFPSTSQIDLEEIYRHAQFQSLIDGLQAFDSLFDERDVAGIGQIGGVLLDNSSILKEELVDTILYFINVKRIKLIIRII